jgi:type IV pilus assembly protein PilN
MTTRINLLPWRQTERVERKQEFLMLLGIGALISVLLLVPVYLYFSSLISQEKALNSYMKNEIAQLDEQVESIKMLKQERSQLLARMNIIQQLQQDRSRMVHLFDDLVAIIPNGIYFTSLDKKEAEFTINGISDSNESISQLMLNIDRSQWVTKPVLKQINSQNKNGERENNFQMTMSLKLPQQGPAEGESF